MSETDLTKTTIIDGVAATEDWDNQNEKLLLAGADIDALTTKGFFNDNHGSGFINTLGRITEAKKVVKQDDAETARQQFYWEKLKKPFLYVKGYLFDEGDHPNVKALVATMQTFQKMGTPLDMRMSVEGKATDRDRSSGVIRRSVIRNVALTLAPANDSTTSTIINESVKQAVISKCREIGANVDYANAIIKSMEVVNAATNLGFIESSEEINEDPELAKLKTLKKSIEQICSMLKMLSAGTGIASAPSSRVGGSVLMSEGAQKKVISTTFKGKPQLDKEHKKQLLKTLLDKVKKSHPDLTLEKRVEYTLEVFKNKIQ